MHFSAIYFKRIPVIFFMTGILFSCVNDLESVRKISSNASSPNETSTDLEVVYTDGGFTKVHVFAKSAETFSKPEMCTKLRNGVKVHFYNDEGKIASVLTAKYGEINESKMLMLVRDSVQLYNPIKKQRLETEELFWDQKDSVIYTDKAVVVRSMAGIFLGDGIRTNQDFSSYVFLKPRGKIKLNR
jgi:LPS export ABC transporter protein LptC